MAKVISDIKLSETLQLTECNDGFWLYGDTRGMNLAIRAKSTTDALVEALTYYQERLKWVETQYNAVQAKVDAFVSQFVTEDDDF